MSSQTLSLAESITDATGRMLKKYNVFQKVNWGRLGVISVPSIWLFVFFFLPFLVVFKISFAESEIAIPPYSDILNWDAEDAYLSFKLSFSNYIFLFEDALYLDAYWSSVKIAAVATFITLIVGFPMAYLIAWCLFGHLSYCVFMHGWVS